MTYKGFSVACCVEFGKVNFLRLVLCGQRIVGECCACVAASILFCISIEGVVRGFVVCFRSSPRSARCTNFICWLMRSLGVISSRCFGIK